MSDGDLRRLFSTNLPEAHWQAIESWSTGSGVPDAEYCFPQGWQGWIEFKLTATNKVGIRPEQVGWAERRVRMGGRVLLAVRKRRAKSPRLPSADSLYLYRGQDMRAVLLNGLKTPPLGYWAGGPQAWNWREIKGLLTS